MRILIVDDESLIRMDLRDILESEQHEVVGEASNGVEAITMCKELKPDAVLMDVKMPELDGIEAARQIGFNHLAPVVIPTLEMACGRFLDDLESRQQMADLEKTLEERKIIQKATGILMDLYKITEDEAYNRIRQLSMKKRESIVNICKLIIQQASSN